MGLLPLVLEHHANNAVGCGSGWVLLAELGLLDRQALDQGRLGAGGGRVVGRLAPPFTETSYTPAEVQYRQGYTLCPQWALAHGQMSFITGHIVPFMLCR